MYRIYCFSRPSGGGEFVVISDLDPASVVREWAIGGVTLDGHVDIDGDASGLPCDRALSAEGSP